MLCHYVQDKITMSRIRLYYKQTMSVTGNNDCSFVTLIDKYATREINVACDRITATQIDLRMEPKIPITHLLLPEVLMSIIGKHIDISKMYILISDIKNGQYIVHVHDGSDEDDGVQIRISNAILLSVASGIPLIIEEWLMRLQSVPHCDENRERLAVPINSISDDMLQDSLKRAVDNEDYELASELNKEIKRRKEEQ